MSIGPAQAGAGCQGMPPHTHSPDIRQQTEGKAGGPSEGLQLQLDYSERNSRVIYATL